MSSSIDAVPAPPPPFSEPDIVPSEPETTEPEQSSEPPPLTFYTATTEEDLTAALKLVADSIAQQRQTSARALLSHPLNIAIAIAIIAISTSYLPRPELGVALSTGAGVGASVLLAIRELTVGYIRAAELVDKSMIDDREVEVAKFGDEIIGTCVWELKGRGKGRKAEVRAWTVRLRFRGKGIGEGLLERVVDRVREKGGDGVGFANDHANSKRVLWGMYNGIFERGDKRARKALEKTWETRAPRRKR